MGDSTLTLLLLIVLGFTTWQGLQSPAILNKYLFSTEAIRLRRQWIRLVSPAFLHANWGHFFANALTLYFFAGPLEASRGPGFMLGTFFVSVAGGHGVCMLLHRQGDYRAIGASGGALGVLFATILLSPGMTLFIFPLPVPIPAWFYGIGYLLYTVSSLRGGSGVSHEAHLGGMLSGVFLTLLQEPSTLGRQPGLVVGILCIGGGGLWYFHQNPGRVPGFMSWKWKQMRSGKTARKHTSQEQKVDELLDKVSKHGIQSLSARERRILQDASKKRGGRG